jgi:hypothetical protein
MTDGVLEGFTMRKGSTLIPYPDIGENISGGGVNIVSGEVKKCLLVNNKSYNGGAAYGGILRDCLIYGNGATYGGGSYDSHLINCTISANNASKLGGGSYYGKMENSVSFGNISVGSSSNYYNGTIRYSCVSPLSSGDGNIAVDPKFRDSANSDYRLRWNSPCRNSGTSECVQSVTDFAGNQRVVYGKVDMGAYELDFPGDLDFPRDLGLPPDSVALCGTVQGNGIEFSDHLVVINGAFMGHNASSGFTFSAPDVSRLIFRWNVSSEYFYDTLNFYVDDVLTDQISGKNMTWTSVTNTVLTDGPHTFKWEYSKDGDTSVGQDVAWIADVMWSPRSQLTVVNGSGDGDYFIGDVVPLEADAPAPFFVFDHWSGDTNGVANVASPSTLFTMPGKVATVTAAYTPVLFTLSVTNGLGGGNSYTNAQAVEVMADTLPGKVFYRWTGDTGTVADVNASSTTVVIPGESVSLTATYRVMLMVNGGSGGGIYPEQTQVVIAAAAPSEGMVFDRWIGDTATLESVFSNMTMVMLPSTGIVVTATYVYSLPLVVGDGSLSFVKTGIEDSVVVAPGMGASGGPALCFTNLSDSQSTGIETVVQGTGRIRFQWWVGSEAEADFLVFKVDGVMVSAYSGKNKPWVTLTNSVTGPGPHTLRWEYVKDDSGSVAPDAGWLDNIVWEPAMTATVVPVPYVWLDQHPSLLSHAGGSYDIAAQEDIDLDGHTAWQEYVTGSNPTNRDSIFKAHVGPMENGIGIFWLPDLGTRRCYRVEGKTNLTDAAWHFPTNTDSRFFRVKVDMP